MSSTADAAISQCPLAIIKQPGGPVIRSPPDPDIRVFYGKVDSGIVLPCEILTGSGATWKNGGQGFTSASLVVLTRLPMRSPYAGSVTCSVFIRSLSGAMPYGTLRDPLESSSMVVPILNSNLYRA